MEVIPLYKQKMDIIYIDVLRVTKSYISFTIQVIYSVTDRLISINIKERERRYHQRNYNF